MRTVLRRYKRWVTIGGRFETVLRLALQERVGVYAAGKPGMVAWWGFGFITTAKRMRSLEVVCKAADSPLIRRQPQGAWPVVDTGDEIPPSVIRARLREGRSSSSARRSA